MAYANRRYGFNDDDNAPEQQQAAPVNRMACSAHGCTLAGAILNHPGEPSGLCAYHHAANPHDWPKVTQKMNDWSCVTEAITDCRRIHSRPETAANSRLIAEKYALAVAKLKAFAVDWTDELAPKNDHSGTVETYRAWGLRLERFLFKQLRTA